MAKSCAVYNAICSQRTIRIFEKKKIPFSALEKFVNAARLSPTARNLQPLEFVVVNSQENVAKLNELVNFGGIVKEKGRKQGEEAKAFIVILLNKKKNYEHSTNDTGIAAQSIALCAWEQGIGTCIMGSVERKKIKELLSVPEHCDITLVVALGYPKEKPKIVENNEKTKYWIEKNILHVPKRSLKNILHKEKYWKK